MRKGFNVDERRRVAVVGAVLGDRRGRVLLVLRRHPPDAGCWSIPGGRVEPGESRPAAAAREAQEETGLRVRIGEVLGRMEFPGADPETVYNNQDFAATVIGGQLRAGDDAAAARWFSREEMAGLPLTAGLVAYLDEYGAFAPTFP
jgi:acetyl-CoA carboxylase carboxyl transferase subunit beta